MIKDQVLEYTDLQQLSGYTRLHDVIRWANQRGILFQTNRDGIWTTMTALNQSIGISNKRAAANDPYDLDLVGS